MTSITTPVTLTHFTLTQVVGEDVSTLEQPPTISFGPDRLVLGRSDRSDFQVTVPSVSRQHAAIWIADGVPMVEDLGSAHGTLVNSARLAAPAALRSGDLVALGPDVVLLVTASEHPAQRHPRARPLDENTGGSQLVELALQEGTSLARLNAQMEALASTITFAQQTESAELLLEHAVAAIRTALEAECLLALRGDTAEGLVVVARSPSLRDDEEPWQPPSQGILRRALLADHAVVSFDAQLDQRFRHRASVALRNVRSAVCAALRSRERVHGLLYADTAAMAGLFSPADGRFLELIGRCLGARLRQLELEQELLLLQHRRHDTAFRSEELLSNLDVTLKSHLNRLELIADEAAVEEQRPELARLLRAEAERLRADVDGVVCWSDAAVTRQTEAAPSRPQSPHGSDALDAGATRVDLPGSGGWRVSEKPTGELGPPAAAAAARALRAKQAGEDEA
ncbi:MAG: FHA domain-containing protein [Proteobacteria bacterium]|nr:FHA domain-containing protein [Pseudomonadota bacterium]